MAVFLISQCKSILQELLRNAQAAKSRSVMTAFLYIPIFLIETPILIYTHTAIKVWVVAVEATSKLLAWLVRQLRIPS